MIVVQSTVKDSADNVRRFVRRNLAGGADHLLVFLDARSPDVEEALEADDHVTCVRAYGDWWAGRRPAGLNYRQSINASLTACLLAELGWVDWLFHVDGDEAVYLDRDVLGALPVEQRAVRLRPLEVASHPDLVGEPTWFKRHLERDEFALLRTLGVLRRGGNGHYFRGHTHGKVGVRPTTHDLLLTNHQVVDGSGANVDAVTDERLRVLHYESPNREEFIRKWLALMSSGPLIRQRSKREAVGQAVAALLRQDLGEEETRHFLGRLYDRTAVDDVETLRRLGMLVHVELDTEAHPERLPDEARRQLVAMLDGARAVTKDRFRARARGDDLDEVVRSLRSDSSR